MARVYRWLDYRIVDGRNGKALAGQRFQRLGGEGASIAILQALDATQEAALGYCPITTGDLLQTPTCRDRRWP